MIYSTVFMIFIVLGGIEPFAFSTNEVFFGGSEQNVLTQEKQRVHRPDLVSVKPRQFRPFPDSLGGRSAMGDVILRLYLHKSGVAVRYEVLRIFIVEDPCKSVQFYGVGGPSVEEARIRGLIKNEHVLRRFQAWIDESYRNLEIVVNVQHSDFTKSDTVTVLHTLEVNPDIKARSDSFLKYYEVPVYYLADSLGGRKLKGWVAVRVYLDLSGRILCFVPIRILAEEITSGKLLSYSDHSFNPEDNDSTLVHRFTPWIESYLRRLRFSFNKRHVNNIQGIVVDVYLKLNSTKKVRRTTDLGFLLQEPEIF